MNTINEIETFGSNSLQEWRIKVLNRILYIMFGLSTILLLIVILINLKDLNFWLFLPIYIGCYLGIGIVAFIKRIPYVIRSSLFLIILYILRAFGLKESGLSGDGRVFLLAFVATTAIFFGRKSGLIILGITGLTLFVFAWLFTQQIFVIPPIDQANTAKASAWLSGSIVFIILALLLILTITYLLQRLDRTINSNRLMVDELRQHRATLEDEVAQRTKDLSVALSQAEHQAHEKTQLADELSKQRILIHEQSIPIIPVSANVLVMPLVGEFDDQRLAYAQNIAVQTVANAHVRNLILDITGVPTIDTNIAKGLLHIVNTCKLLGSRVTIVGIRPEVAQTLVHLGLDLHAFDTRADLYSALQSLLKIHEA